MGRRPEDAAGSTEGIIRVAYGARLQEVFRFLRAQDNLSAALNAGRQAIVYFVEAQAFDRVANFGLSVIINSGAPMLIGGLLPHLQVAARSAPPGRDGWRCNQILADALDNAGRSEESLPFFERAAAMAKSAAEAAEKDAGEIWEDYSSIVGNWSIALQNVGDSFTARQRQLERGEALRKAQAPAYGVISSELEILRMDIREGKAAEVLGDVESRVAKMADWWRRSRAGESVPEAPWPDLLAQLYLNALYTDREARVALEDWEGARNRTSEVVELITAVGHPRENIAIEFRNHATLLAQLRRYPEAKAALEWCLGVFENDPVNLARTRFALSEILDQLEDVPQAIVQMRRALAIFDTMPNPQDRCGCHNNLAVLLDRSKPPATAEADRHRLAALVYGLVGTLGEGLKAIFANFVDHNSSFPAGAAPATPRLAELLAAPAFQALNSWLCQRSVDTSDLQSNIDRFLELAQQAGLKQK
jgi:tetratricopeptide (TPR) repeat protein